MYNTQQGGGYSLPYQSRLDSLNQEKVPQFPTATPLPLQRPGQQNTETALPIPPKPEVDPMQEVSQGDFFKSNQVYMQDPAYSQGFNELVATAGALRDQVQKGYMPDTIAQERLQNHILTLRNDMMKAMEAPQEEPEQRGQAAKAGALDGSIEEQMANLTPEQRAEIEAMVPASETMDDGEGGPSDEELEQQMAADPEAQAAMEGQAQAQEPKPMIDPRYMVSDPSIEAATMRNANRAQGIGDYMGNLPQAPQPTPSEMVNAEYNASAATLSDAANMQQDWWKSDSFVYSMTRMAIGLLDGESPAEAFAGANQSYMMLSGMEKRQAFIPDLKRQGYSDAQIEEYVRTGESKVLRERKAEQAPKWSSAGGGMMMNTAGEVRPIPGWKDKSQEITPYQAAQLDLAERRLAAAEARPVGGRQVVSSEFETDDQGRTFEVTQYNDGTEMRKEKKATGRASEGERIQKAIEEAADDQYVAAKGPRTQTDGERVRIGQFQETYRRSANHIRDVMAGKYKPLELHSVSANVRQAIVDDPENFLTSAMFDRMTKEQQEGLRSLYAIIDPVARARSGAAIGKTEMSRYLQFAGDIHKKDEAGARARLGFVSTMSGMVAGSRRDMNTLQNDVLPTAVDARPAANGMWNIAYRGPKGEKKVFEFKPGRF